MPVFKINAVEVIFTKELLLLQSKNNKFLYSGNI